MVRRLTLAVLFLVSFAIVVPNVPVVGMFTSSSTAVAQEKQRKSLFDLIRERRAKSRKAREDRAKKQKRASAKAKKRSSRQKVRERQRRQKKRRGLFDQLQNQDSDVAQKPRIQDSSDPREPAVVRVKEQDAAKILIVGDFIATGIAREMTKLYAGNPNFRVVSKTSPASGIVRYDVVNWEKEIPELVQQHKPIAIILLLGMNDRQAMRLPGGRLKELTDPWKKQYEARVSNLAGFSLKYNVPLVWVGLPPVRFSKMNRDYLTFNELYRTKTEAVGGKFVDVWDGFTNQDGKFVSAGPDINGQIVRLRGSKGINMTRAGSRKLVFYVDKELRKFGISPDATQLQLAALGNFNNSASTTQPLIPQYDPVGSGTTVVISLGAANASNIEPLAGGANFLESKAKVQSVSYQLVETGTTYEPKSGRVDAGWGLAQPISRSSDMSDAQKRHMIVTPR